MIIKKFTGKTEEEAIALAKAELGESVVVMNVKQAKKKGLFGLLGKKKIEVTVAKEEENERYPVAEKKEDRELRETFRQVAEAAEAIRDIAPGTDGMRKPASEPARSVDIRVTNDTLIQAENEKSAGAASTGSRGGNSATAPTGSTGNTTAVIERKLDSLHNMLEKQLQGESETVRENGRDAVKEPPKENSAEEKNSEQSSEMIRFMRLLYNTMIDNEVNEKYANQILDELEKNLKPGMPFDHALASVYQKMILKFGKPDPIAPASRGPRVVFFIGPTGVGKTTTIAKVASQFSVDQKKKVALLTADTYRIAAAEQLRTYANILEVPFRVIYSVEEMQNAIQDFASFDYVLVDTAGHSHQNIVQKENMNAFIHSLDDMVEKEVHLVLSATTKYRDLLSIADTYMDMTTFKIIFTKLDETTTLGNLLNLKLYTESPLSYVTCGQNVPDDIELFQPQKTVKQLLGGKN